MIPSLKDETIVPKVCSIRQRNFKGFVIQSVSANANRRAMVHNKEIMEDDNKKNLKFKEKMKINKVLIF